MDTDETDKKDKNRTNKTTKTHSNLIHVTHKNGLKTGQNGFRLVQVFCSNVLPVSGLKGKTDTKKSDKMDSDTSRRHEFKIHLCHSGAEHHYVTHQMLHLTIYLKFFRIFPVYHASLKCFMPTTNSQAQSFLNLM